MRQLQNVQTWAADRWRFVPHPRLYRVVRPKRDVIGAMLRWGLFAWAMGLIWGGVALGALIVAVTLIG